MSLQTNKQHIFTVLLFLIINTIAIAQKEKPNVIIFFADDFGYGSTNIYGAKETLIKTPNINKLGEEGIKFNNAYTTGSVCTPTRYGLITGEYSWRSSLKKGVVNQFDKMLVSVDKKTLPKYMKSLGYQTGAVGKWHLGLKDKHFKNLLGDIYPSPNDIGFDYSFMVPNNLDDGHKIYVENNKIYGLRSDKLSPYGKSFYGKQYTGYDAPQRVTENVMNDITDKSVEWLNSLKKDEPFFLYYASVAVHHPITPSPEMRGKSNAGAYGDFIQDIDRCLGVLIDYLEKNNLRENTLIIFASDNGGDIPNKKGLITPENFAVKKGLNINGDLRGDKHTIWEGGFKIPFIVNHPGKIYGNTTSDVVVSTVDIYGFLADYIGSNKKLKKEDAPDSYSFADVLNNPKSDYKRPPLVHRDAAGRKAIRFDGWKYIEAKNQNPKRNADGELLYHIKNDEAEKSNLLNSEDKIKEKAKEYLEKVIASNSKSIWKQ